MNSSSVAMMGLAHRLIALEATPGAAAGEPAAVAAPGPGGGTGAKGLSQEFSAMRVVIKLRAVLERFSGPAGFAALLRRALSLAKAGNPALEAVRLEPDGSLTGFAEVTGDHAATLIVHLLELLSTFVGHRIMLTLLAEAWPNGLTDSPR